MNKAQLWNLIDDVNQATERQEKDAILMATQQKLLELSAREIVDFHNYLTLYMDLADTSNLVAAAVAINGGISDDGFTDFRAWLVSLGKDTYRNALKKADSLAEVEIGSEPYGTLFEFYGYIASYAYEVKMMQEQKGMEQFCGNEYFSLTPKGVELVQQMLEYHCAYENPFANSKDPFVQSLYQTLRSKISAADIYDAAKDYPLSEEYKKEIRDGLEFEAPIPCPHRWSPADVQKAVPELYSKYCEHGYTLGGM